MTEAGRASWVVLLSRGDESSISNAAAMAASAASLGVAVTLVWFGDALDALVSGDLEESDLGEASAASLLALARESGRVRSLACSASAVSGKGGVERVRSRVDEIVGWPTVVSLVRASEKAFVW